MLFSATEKVPVIVEGGTERFYLVKHSSRPQAGVGSSTSGSDKRLTLAQTYSVRHHAAVTSRACCMAPESRCVRDNPSYRRMWAFHLKAGTP